LSQLSPLISVCFFTQHPWLPDDKKGGGLDHHKLQVYHRSLFLLKDCDYIVQQLPQGRAHIRDQIERATCSIVANIAEGAGAFRHKEKARFYRMARRCAIEVAAWLEITALRKEAAESDIRQALQRLENIVSMLVKLILSCVR
jgi:four helix bundle protein